MSLYIYIERVITLLTARLWAWVRSIYNEGRDILVSTCTIGRTMWRLRIAAETGNVPHLFSTNNYVGRQIWEFDANSGSPEEREEVDRARENFSINRSCFKASADLLWRMQVYHKH